MNILVINCGSSSLKYALFLEGKLRFKKGLRLEEDLEGYLENILEEIKTFKLDAIGHRVVHGGDLNSPLRIDDGVIKTLESLTSLSPIHNYLSLKAIKFFSKALPQVPQYAVFDTSFFKTLPEYSRIYAIPYEFYKAGVKKYGFHGISYSYLLRRSAELLGKAPEETSLIILHLGSGASACAIHKGRPVETSMGMTPLEGLVMNTRPGDLDPGVLLHLLKTGMSLEELEEMLYRRSGIKGLSGKDPKDLNEEDLAFKVYIHRIKKYVGAYLALLPEVDALVFSGGVGERSERVRRSVCKDLEHLGIVIDEEKNGKVDPPAFLQKENSKLKILVLETDEELEIFLNVEKVIK
ncbi:acetate/propionate family kinase [Thermocrinis sp.]